MPIKSIPDLEDLFSEKKNMITGEDKASMFASRNMYMYLIYYG